MKIKLIKKILLPVSFIFQKIYFYLVQKNKIYVPLFHNIYDNEMVNCKELIKNINKKSSFLDPKDLQSFFENRLKNIEDNFLITFDDGFYSNYVFTKEVLDPMNIKAIFFVCTDFIGIENKSNINEFIINKIFDGKTPEKINQMNPMSWENLQELSENGHLIGSHTKNHARLSSLKNKNVMIDEIVNSGDYIEEKLKIKVDHFAYPFGDINSINREALLIASQRYNFIHSGIRGYNSFKTSPKTIRRQSINTNDSPFYNEFLIRGGWSEFYRKNRKRIDAMI